MNKTVTIDVGVERVVFAWGAAYELGSAAFWIDQTRQRAQPTDFRLGHNLREEVAACILGGYGLPADTGLGAFRAVKEAGLLNADKATTAGELEFVLRQPLESGRRSRVLYRFPRQRAARLAAALRYLDEHDEPLGEDVRRWLLDCPGVGPKTAAWVMRNRGLSEEVAIIDVHIHRAGLAAGFFLPSWRLPHDYDLFEQAFCTVASLGVVKPAALDACIWDICRSLGSARALLLGDAVPT
jgi:N-glycosylase/DNA lyase